MSRGGGGYVLEPDYGIPTDKTCSHVLNLDMVVWVGMAHMLIVSSNVNKFPGL